MQSTSALKTSWSCPSTRLHCSPVDEAQSTPHLAWWQRAFQKRRKFVYTSSGERAPTSESVAQLWAACFDRPELLCEEGATLVATALRNSFTVTYAFVQRTDAASPGEAAAPELIGTARSLSDGHFAAQLLDVCVHEDYRKQGVGTKLVKLLLAEAKNAGPQSFAVFVGQVRRCTARAAHVALSAEGQHRRCTWFN